MDLGLRNRVAIVTGSSRGLGKASATALAGEGARVVINGRAEDSLRAAADEIRAAGGIVEPVVADVTTEAGCQLLVDRAIQAFG
jgi:3-oxoacyl-[acyl-carrier protein] reductase